MNILTWYAPSNNGAFQKLTEFGYFSDMLTVKPTFSFEFTSMSYNEQNNDFSIDGVPMNDEQKLEVLDAIVSVQVPFAFYKAVKTQEINGKYTQELRALTTANSYEAVSWTKQEIQARAWIVDNAAATPIIDALLIARNMNETKEELINKIIAKADAYETLYSAILGKFHNREKALEVATTLEELKAISW